MRYAAAILVAFACTGAFASEPGSHMDCSDMVFHVPGLSCQPFIPIGVIQDTCNDERWWHGSNLATDNLGGLLYVKRLNDPSRIEIRRNTGSSEELLASITARANPYGWDGVKPRTTDGQLGCVGYPNFVNAGTQFDAANGRLLIWIVSESNTAGGFIDAKAWVASIEGFATTFEILQSFTPQPSLGFSVPYMPEGMPAADHFDTYTGPLTKPIDFAQAQPLACDYPASPPAVGDYLTVADPLPDPAPGTGRYYVTAATYQGQTRYGRETTAGVLSGRDPALLPACTPQ